MSRNIILKLKIADPYNFDWLGGIKEISLDDFKKIFLNRGIVVNNIVS